MSNECPTIAARIDAAYRAGMEKGARSIQDVHAAVREMFPDAKEIIVDCDTPDGERLRWNASVYRERIDVNDLLASAYVCSSPERLLAYLAEERKRCLIVVNDPEEVLG